MPWSEREEKEKEREMECLLGLLKVRVVRGVHLAICDPLTHSSDPYVVLRHGQQVNCIPLHQLRSYSIGS